jgi:serine/threonine protein kinase
MQIQNDNIVGLKESHRGGAAARRKVIREKIKLLSQGAYGCVYRPNIQCNGRPGTSQNFVSKLQKRTTSANEIAIGVKLMKIPNFNFHFAPVIRSCPIQLSKLNPELIGACNVAKKEAEHGEGDFILNRIRYIGSETLEKYLTSRMNNGYFMLKFFEIHMYLLRSVSLLVEANVVQFDLKENNIMYDPKNQVPIIIDFGMSADMSFLTATDMAAYDAAFHIYYAKYPPWCLDIVLCSYLVQESVLPTDKKAQLKPGAWATKRVDINQLLQITDSYFSGNDIMQMVGKLNPAAVAKSRAKWRQYISTQFVGKTRKQVVDMLALAGWKSWDNFGMAVIFMTIWTRYKLEGMVEKGNQEYQQVLMTVITGLPGERPTAETTGAEIFSVARTLTKKSYAASRIAK